MGKSKGRGIRNQNILYKKSIGNKKEKLSKSYFLVLFESSSSSNKLTDQRTKTRKILDSDI